MESVSMFQTAESRIRMKWCNPFGETIHVILEALENEITQFILI